MLVWKRTSSSARFLMQDLSTNIKIAFYWSVLRMHHLVSHEKICESYKYTKLCSTTLVLWSNSIAKILIVMSITKPYKSCHCKQNHIPDINRVSLFTYMKSFKENLATSMKFGHDNGGHGLITFWSLNCLATVAVAVWVIFFQLMSVHTYMYAGLCEYNLITP